MYSTYNAVVNKLTDNTESAILIGFDRLAMIQENSLCEMLIVDTHHRAEEYCYQWSIEYPQWIVKHNDTADDREYNNQRV